MRCRLPQAQAKKTEGSKNSGSFLARTELSPTTDTLRLKPVIEMAR
jgi:hypothetical protein